MNNQNLEYIKKYLKKDKLNEGIELLKQGIAPQYIVGNVDFYGNIIEVNESVLIPRFETELLVDKTIAYIKKKFCDFSDLNILDIGTGSGCIAISLNKVFNSNVMAVDISEDALKVASDNAINNKVKIDFRHSDIFEKVDGCFDVIISNPPYIREDESIDEMVKNNEPYLALFAKDDGLYFYTKILRECKSYLRDKFLIAFEIGFEQGEVVKNLAFEYLVDVDVLVEKDYSGKDRFVFISNK